MLTQLGETLGMFKIQLAHYFYLYFSLAINLNCSVYFFDKEQ
jgi:hypothetical protein